MFNTKSFLATSFLPTAFLRSEYVPADFTPQEFVSGPTITRLFGAATVTRLCSGPETKRLDQAR